MALDIDLERLVTVGSTQLGPEYLPPHFGHFYDALTADRSFDLPVTTRDLSRVYPQIVPVIEYILEAAHPNSEVTADMSRSFNDRIERNEQPSHRDGFETPRRGIVTGFAILNSQGYTLGYNGLITAGRQRQMLRSIPRVAYDYREGPIVMAQKGFTIPGIQVPYENGNTWHKGEREVGAKFISIDVHGAPKELMVE